MEIILLEDIDRLGHAGEVIKVKDGHARNFLIPKGLAEKATAQSLQRVALIEKRRQDKMTKIKIAAEEQATQLSALSLTLSMQAGVDDKLYGAVTSQDLAEAFGREGHSIDKKDILLDEPIKELGVFHVDVKLHQDVTAQVKVWVVKE